jgi:hypothetical protein
MSFIKRMGMASHWGSVMIIRGRRVLSVWIIRSGTNWSVIAGSVNSTTSIWENHSKRWLVNKIPLLFGEMNLSKGGRGKSSV